MKARRIRAVEMVRQIRDRQARLLRNKTRAEVLAFFRAAGEEAMADARRRSRTRRKAG